VYICLAWEQNKLAQIVYSVAIWFLNDWIETQIKKILKLWKANQKNFEALIRCVSNLSPNSNVTIDTIHPIVCRTQSKCFEYATLQSACGFTKLILRFMKTCWNTLALSTQNLMKWIKIENINGWPMFIYRSDHTQ